MKKVLFTSRILLFVGSTIFASCKKERSSEEFQENNKPPIAVAGPDQVIALPSDSILLDGSSSNDPDGTISDPIAIGWLWKKYWILLLLIL